MSKADWYRRSTWTDDDRHHFNNRLNRVRSPFGKSQYLRIQAFHLAEAGHHSEAIELLDRVLAEYPDESQLAQSHAQKADSLAKLDQIEAAIGEYRAALQAQREFPNARTNAWLDFGWLAIERQLTDIYGELAQVMMEFREDGGLMFPVLEFQYRAIHAVLADARGEKEQARRFAEQALFEAGKTHSGLRYHPRLGLVGFKLNTIERRLKELANP